MKKIVLTTTAIIMLNSCNSKPSENQDSFTEETPVYEGVDNTNEDYYKLGDSTQNAESKNNDENIPVENVKGEISQDSAIYEGVQEEE